MRSTTLLLAPWLVAGAALATDLPAQEPEERSPAIVRAFMWNGDRAAIGVTLAADSGAADTLGVRVTEVTPDGPAAKAGVTVGDHIVGINDVDLRVSPADARDEALRGIAARRLTRELRRVDAGDEVELRLWRDGRTRTVKVRTVAARELAGSAAARPMRARLLNEDRASLGVSVRATGTARDTLGAFVQSVVPGGPAERAGVVEGMRIASINGVDLRVAAADVEDRTVGRAKAARLSRELERMKAGDQARLRVWANGQYRDITVRTERMGDVYKGRAWSLAFPEGGFELAPMPRVRVAPGAPAAPRPPRTRVRVPDGDVRVWIDGFGPEDFEIEWLTPDGELRRWVGPDVEVITAEALRAARAASAEAARAASEAAVQAKMASSRRVRL